MGLAINYFIKVREKFSLIKIVVVAIVLLLIDQAIKTVMMNSQEINISVIKDWLVITGKYNSPESPISARYLVSLPFPLYLIQILPLFLIYKLLAKTNKYFLSIGMTFLSAGTFCFLVDKIVYGFSYHYILLNHLVVVDLGFFYLMLGVCVLFQAIVYDIAWNKVLEKLMTNRSIANENPKV